jgi:hypothetical protein
MLPPGFDNIQTVMKDPRLAGSWQSSNCGTGSRLEDMVSRRRRYELRPLEDRWVAWDTAEKRIARDCSWRFLHKRAAIEAVDKLNEAAK